MHKYDAIKADIEDVARAFMNGMNYFLDVENPVHYIDEDIEYHGTYSSIDPEERDFIEEWKKYFNHIDHILLLNGGTIRISYFFGETPNEVDVVGECSCLGDSFYAVLLLDYKIKEIRDGHKDVVKKLFEWVCTCKQRGIEPLDLSHQPADIKIGQDFSFEEKIEFIVQIAGGTAYQAYSSEYDGYNYGNNGSNINWGGTYYIDSDRYNHDYTPSNPCTFEIDGRHIGLYVAYHSGYDELIYFLKCKETGTWISLLEHELGSEYPFYYRNLALLLMHLATEPESKSIDTTDTDWEYDQIKSILAEAIEECCSWEYWHLNQPEDCMIQLHNRQIRIQLQYDRDKRLFNACLKCTTTGKKRNCVFENNSQYQDNLIHLDKLARIVQELAWVDEDEL